MKKAILLALTIILAFGLACCSQKAIEPALPFMVSNNDELGCVELLRDGITYRPFGIADGKSLRNEKIGIHEGDSEVVIFSVKGYDSSEWILESDAGFMPASDMLFKAVTVKDIPSELERYKEYNY